MVTGSYRRPHGSLGPGHVLGILCAFPPHLLPDGGHYYPRVTEDTEAENGDITYPGSHSGVGRFKVTKPEGRQQQGLWSPLSSPCLTASWAGTDHVDLCDPRQATSPSEPYRHSCLDGQDARERTWHTMTTGCLHCLSPLSPLLGPPRAPVTHPAGPPTSCCSSEHQHLSCTP